MISAVRNPKREPDADAARVTNLARPGDGRGVALGRPGVGVGVIVSRGDDVLLVRRRYHGAGSWSTPGGYLERGEAFAACAVRETREETGILIDAPWVVGVANDVHEDCKHNVTVWLVARALAGEAAVTSDESDAVAWFRWDDLPEPLYRSTRDFFDGRVHPADAWDIARARLTDRGAAEPGSPRR